MAPAIIVCTSRRWPGHVDQAHLQAVAERPRREAQLDGDPAPLLFGQPIGVDAGQRAHERRLAVIDMARRTEDEAPHAPTLVQPPAN
jgi:hypothetical protein